MTGPSRRLRYEILRRDHYACRYCGRRAPGVELTIDHVHPVALGGTDDPSNLVAACVDCNAGKTSMPLDAPTVTDIEEDAFRWARAVEVVANMRRAERRWIMDQTAIFNDAWCGWRTPDGSHAARPADWSASIEHFLALGLQGDDLAYFVDVTMRRPNIDLSERWVYFCGCCWRELDNIHQEAKRIATGESEEP